jgi:hypothetical protein
MKLKTKQDKKNCSEIEVGKYNRQTQSCQDFSLEKEKKQRNCCSNHRNGQTEEAMNV